MFSAVLPHISLARLSVCDVEDGVHQLAHRSAGGRELAHPMKNNRNIFGKYRKHNGRNISSRRLSKSSRPDNTAIGPVDHSLGCCVELGMTGIPPRTCDPSHGPWNIRNADQSIDSFGCLVIRARYSVFWTCTYSRLRVSHPEFEPDRYCVWCLDDPGDMRYLL